MTFFDPDFTFGCPEMDKNPGVCGWVYTFSNNILKNVFFGIFPLYSTTRISKSAAGIDLRYALIQGEVPADSLASFINAQIYPAFRFENRKKI